MAKPTKADLLDLQIYTERRMVRMDKAGTLTNDLRRKGMKLLSDTRKALRDL